MTDSRVNTSLALLLFAGFLAIGAQAVEPQAAGPASAPPRGLSPDTQPPADELPPDAIAPPAQTPAGAAPWQPPAEQVVPDQIGGPSGPRITVSGLTAINPDSAGLLSDGSGGFASNLWAGSQRSTVVSRMAQLPSAPASPAMQGLLRRLLLSSAAPPSGAAPPDEPSLLAVRVAKLVANGWIGEAESLAARSPRDDGFARQALAESLLLQGRDADACSDATALRQSANDPYWLKLRVLCYLQQQDLPSAVLTLDVMRERGITDDAFFALAGALAEGAKAQTTALPAPSGLHLALLHQAGIAPPAALAAWAPATNLLSQASGDSAIRLAASERAAVAGLLPADQLRAIYETESFTPDQIDDPAEAAAKLPPARANALYFQSIVKRTIPAARAGAFAAALQRAETQNRFVLFAELTSGLALQIKPSPQTAWLAPYIERPLHYIGNDKAAAQWLLVLTSPTDAPTVNAIQIHAGLARPTPENLARMQGAMAWLGQNALLPSGSKEWLMERATREIPLLDALGYIVPPDAQWAVSATTAGISPTGPAAEALASLSRASVDGRLGETLLNALVALGPGGPSRAQGQTVVRVVKALMAVGLRNEARAIAIESVLSAPVRLRK
ncbi:MAG: hypothetical protein K8S25_10035 [Alphaproteobacteria bacterium]|nr:hypothetical protein [Alphaproteobacteria bacterium]